MVGSMLYNKYSDQANPTDQQDMLKYIALYITLYPWQWQHSQTTRAGVRNSCNVDTK